MAVIATLLVVFSLFPGLVCKQPLPGPPSSTGSHSSLTSLLQASETESQSKPFLPSDGLVGHFLTATQLLMPRAQPVSNAYSGIQFCFFLCFSFLFKEENGVWVFVEESMWRYGGAYMGEVCVWSVYEGRIWRKGVFVYGGVCRGVSVWVCM